MFSRSWNAITRQDFLPVIDPAVEALDAATSTARLGGLRRALRHLAAEAEQIAETYADMGTDHAGALFNKVMGDQSSDGAFFTRPVAADIAARLALEAVDPDNALDWSDPDVWRHHKTVDLACGSGTLLTAAMTEMKRRAAHHGADQNRLAELQKVAVEEMLKGLDINAVSLQLAATQLMAGNTDIKYRKMGLHLMPYGPQSDGAAAASPGVQGTVNAEPAAPASAGGEDGEPDKESDRPQRALVVSAGSPELFGRQDIVFAGRLFDDAAASTTVKTGAEHPDSTLEGPEMDDATAASRDARIIIMNPPFTNRTKMGEKFDPGTRQALRRRMDTLEGFLTTADQPLSEILDKNSLRPRFAALADLCLNREEGVFSTVLPTTALTAMSGLPERLELAKRFHIHTILTHMGVMGVNLSQGTHREMNESIVVLRRQPAGNHPPTRIISLDRFPRDDTETDHLFACLDVCEVGTLRDGWGEVSHWPAERITAGDWSVAAWRSPALAAAAAEFAARNGLAAMRGGGDIHKTGPTLSGDYRRTTPGGNRWWSTRRCRRSTPTIARRQVGKTPSTNNPRHGTDDARRLQQATRQRLRTVSGAPIQGSGRAGADRGSPRRLVGVEAARRTADSGESRSPSGDYGAEHFGGSAHGGRI